ncbi:AmpG family muropeptide MFS transporter [Arenimonas sp.]|uniref:AmpG family muropeptide MFS transporter n=1 Tax=Arenimonas sp. TaxID=1872635 RepID=UPI0039E686A3
MLFLGFASGLPLPMVLTTLSARLRLDGIDRTTIGLFSLVGLAYSMKFLWSPIVDRYRLPGVGGLGQRRGWLLLAQLGVIVGLLLMAMHEPTEGVQAFALLAVFTAFCSATQDIVVDAYRIESVDASLQGSSSAAYQVGYQVALICSGALALVVASHADWTQSYFLIAGLLLVGVFTTLRVREPERTAVAASIDHELVADTIARMRPLVLVISFLATALLWLLLRGPLAAKGDSTLALDSIFAAVGLVELLLLAVLLLPGLRGLREKLVVSTVLPIRDIGLRFGWRLAVPMLLLIVTYRLNYTTMGVAANSFYVDMGYTLDQIAAVSKVYGVILTLVGAVFAGWLVRALGFMRSMLLGVVLLSGANLFYAHVATLAGEVAPSIWWLAAAISLDNVANGIAGTAFIAYMSSLTSKQYTATQYALFGTLWSLPAKTIASQWGRIVDAIGYPAFFVYTAVVALPAVLLILWVMRADARRAGAAAASAAGDR